MSLIDKRAVLMVLGSLMNRPSLINTSTEDPISTEDFEEKFHKIVFSAINNLQQNGFEKITPIAIDNYLSNFNVQYKTFQENDGLDYLENISAMVDADTYDYYYDRLKKFSALRHLKSEGYDISSIYNESIVSPIEKEKMLLKFDEMTLSEIFLVIEKKFIIVKEKYVKNLQSHGQLAGEGLMTLKENLKETPEIGMPLQGDLLNSITRGARLKKLYMRSGASGVGKTRLAIGSAATLSCGYYFDLSTNTWVVNGATEPTLFITTELEFDEVQTPLLGFLSGVSEENILNGRYLAHEEKRIDEAINLVEKAPIWIEYLPNYSITEVVDVIKKYVLLHGVKYVFFDYVHTTIKMLQDLSAQSRGMKLREDNVLSMFAATLKDTANELDVFIHTGTQLNRSWASAEGDEINETMLRGAMSLADKLDVGAITLPVRPADLEMLRATIKSLGVPEPNSVTTFYKVRRSRWRNAKVWSQMDLGTCRSRDLFATDSNYNILPIEPVSIILKKSEYAF